MRLVCGITGLLIAVSASVAVAADRADLEGTQIIGSRELPKVLYIVPWKPPEAGDLVKMPVDSLLEEALAPVDRDVFRRQVQYHQGLHGSNVTR